MYHMSYNVDSRERQYLSSRYEKFRRHIRENGVKAAVSGVSVAGITAGFLSAAQITWPLLAYLGIILFVGAVALCLFGLPASWPEYLMLLFGNRRHIEVYGRPRQLELGV